MQVTTLGRTALTGWREKVAEPVARSAPIDTDLARAIIGGAFFVASLVYVVRTLRRITREARG